MKRSNGAVHKEGLLPSLFTIARYPAPTGLFPTFLPRAGGPSLALAYARGCLRVGPLSLFCGLPIFLVVFFSPPRSATAPGGAAHSGRPVLER